MIALSNSLRPLFHPPRDTDIDRTNTCARVTRQASPKVGPYERARAEGQSCVDADVCAHVVPLVVRRLLGPPRQPHVGRHLQALPHCLDNAHEGDEPPATGVADVLLVHVERYLPRRAVFVANQLPRLLRRTRHDPINVPPLRALPIDLDCLTLSKDARVMHNVLAVLDFCQLRAPPCAWQRPQHTIRNNEALCHSLILCREVSLMPHHCAYQAG